MNQKKLKVGRGCWHWRNCRTIKSQLEKRWISVRPTIRKLLSSIKSRYTKRTTLFRVEFKEEETNFYELKEGNHFSVKSELVKKDSVTKIRQGVHKKIVHINELSLQEDWLLDTNDHLPWKDRTTGWEPIRVHPFREQQDAELNKLSKDFFAEVALVSGALVDIKDYAPASIRVLSLSLHSGLD